MTRDNIIRMAREANGGPNLREPTMDMVEVFERFAALVAAAEREACAKVCEQVVANATDWDSSYWDAACMNCSAAIQARGQA